MIANFWILVSDDHGNQWQHLEIFLGPRQNFNLVIQARRGRSFTGDLSVDSINFINCQPPISVPQGCQANNYQCNNGYCVEQNLKCDFSNDCGDSSDEIVNFCVLYSKIYHLSQPLCYPSSNLFNLF